MRVLVTDGAGFIGANVALGLASHHPEWELVALDNLRRRGGELNVPRLRAGGVSFVHGDVREIDDLLCLGNIDALVECSAEPSALAGVDDGPSYVVKSNLLGAYNCLELARRCGAHLVFLSTSRVYPVRALRQLAIEEDETRFRLSAHQPFPAASPAGIAEGFPLDIGFGGHGKQVRDLLHVDDLVVLLEEQLVDPRGWDGAKLNVGGGRSRSLSLLETSAICEEITGHRAGARVWPRPEPGMCPCTSPTAVSWRRDRNGGHDMARARYSPISMPGYAITRWNWNVCCEPGMRSASISCGGPWRP